MASGISGATRPKLGCIGISSQQESHVRQRVSQRPAFAGILGDLTRSAGKSDTSDLRLSLDELGNAAFIREMIDAIQ